MFIVYILKWLGSVSLAKMLPDFWVGFAFILFRGKTDIWLSYSLFVSEFCHQEQKFFFRKSAFSADTDPRIKIPIQSFFWRRICI